MSEWFVKFRQGELGVEDRERSVRSVADIDDHIKVLITENHQISMLEIGEGLDVSNSAVYEHLLGWLR